MDDRAILTSCSFKGSDDMCADTISDENIILEDWESYWNDLSARLTVSRMVSDSVIRGIVNAVVQEAEESNSLKEAEIARLVKRLLLYEPDMAIERRPSPMISKEQHDHVGQTMGNTRHLLNLSIAAEKHLWSLKSGIETLRSSAFCKVLNAGSESFRSCCIHDHTKASNNLTRLGESVDALEVIFTTICQQIDVLTYLSKDSQFDQQWEWKFQREIDTIIYESFLKEQREAIDMALCKQKNMFDIQNNFWLKEVQELSCLHQELESISKSILSIEPEHPHAHENFKDRNTSKGKDQFVHKMYGDDFAITTSHVGENGIPSREKANKETPEVSDSNLLFNMSKEDLMSYYQNEINNIKRQHEAALHESTEEVFRFKRQYLNEWGSLHHKKDKYLELLKKRIPDIVLKLGKVLLETKKFPSIQEQHDNTCTFKQRIGSLTVKNRHLHDLLSNKGKEVDYLSLQLSYSKKQLANYSTKETNFLKEVEKHKWDIKNMMVEARQKIEDVQMEDFIKNQVYKCVISDLICKVVSQMEDLYMENMLIQEFYSFTLRGLVMDAYSSMILSIMHDEEKRALIRTISQNEVALELENEKTRQLKQEHSKLMVMINEKENALSRELKKSEGLHREIMALSGFLKKQNNFISDLELKLVQQKEHVDVVLKDLILLKDQASEKKKLVSEDKRGTNLLEMELDKALKRNQLLDAVISELNQRLGVLSTELGEAEKQRAALSNIIQLKQNEITSLSTDLREVEKQKANLSDVVQQKQNEILVVTAQRDEQVEQLESIVIFVQGLSESVAEFEGIIMLSIERRSSRLEALSSQYGTLKKHIEMLKRREVWYRKRMEIRTSDLEKAETEVDLLGDEVDALLNILEKIYIALDHYSPILQHYPGVMEILKLVRRELRGSD